MLKCELERYGKIEELDGGARELATNISQALIRWLPHDPESIDWLKEQSGKTVFHKAIRSNLYLALWHRGEEGYANKIGTVFYAKDTDIEPVAQTHF